MAHSLNLQQSRVARTTRLTVGIFASQMLQDTTTLNNLLYSNEIIRRIGDMNKFQHIVKQFIRYFGVALVGYVFDFGSLILLREVLGAHYLVAASIGFIIGLIIVYFLSNRYVFGESKVKSKSLEFGIFALVGIIGLAILNLLMWVFTEQFGINYLLSKVIATVFVYMWNFFARRSLYHD